MTYLKKMILFGAAVFMVVSLSSCEDLVVTNKNEPDRERALNSPEDIETLISGSYRTFYYAGESYAPNFALSVAADEISSSWGNFAMQFFGSEPRVPVNNDPSFAYAYVIEDPFSGSYSAISAAVDGLTAINEGLALENEAQTKRAKAFAQFVIGISHAHIAVIYDKGFVVTKVPAPGAFDPANPPFKIQPSSAVFQAGLTFMQKAIQTAESAPAFTIPAGWIGETEYTKEEFIGIIKMYRAHYRASMPRTPEEELNVDWQAVLNDINGSYTEITGKDFKIVDTAEERWFSGIRYYGKNAGWTRVDIRTIGPADTTGAYQDWLDSELSERFPFGVETADKRISGHKTVDGVDYGKYFYRSGPAPFPQARGIYHYALYTYNRNWDTYQNYAQGNYKLMITHSTMQLLKAEALLHINAQANKARVVDIINQTRVGVGELPPATMSDPIGSMLDPQSALADASLWSKLKHEKRMESFGTICGLAFFDDRGWGGLVVGTPIALPIPGSELLVLKKAIYTTDVVGSYGDENNANQR